MENTTNQPANKEPVAGKELVDTLRKHLRNADVFGDDPQTGADFHTWNTKTACPLARVECRSVADVQAALRIAREFGVPLSVSGGRLDPDARTNLDGHLILDLRRMAAVSHDTIKETVTLQGGVTTGNLLGVLPEDIITVTGWNPDIGVVGLTLGGGYSGLNGRFGLACDNLRSAQMVLADGDLAHVSVAENTELYWALRGGGTGFGVVTSLTLATYRVRRVLCATLVFQLRSARQALLAEQELLDAEPDSLGLLPLFTLSPNGEPALFMVMHWTGEPSGGEKILQRLSACEGAQVLKQGWVPYRETVDSPKTWPWGKLWHGETRTIKRLDESAAEMLADAAGKIVSPDQKLFLHDLHGAPARVPPDATAFPLRTSHFVVEVVSGWSIGDGQAAASRRAWVEETSRQLAAIALPGGYINFLRSDQAEQVRLFYGASVSRLRRIKNSVDPEDVFHASTGRLPDENRTGE